MIELKNGSRLDKCLHHEAIDIRLCHLEIQIRNIQRMFAAILVAILINLCLQYITFKETVVNVKNAEATEHKTEPNSKHGALALNDQMRRIYVD